MRRSTLIGLGLVGIMVVALFGVVGTNSDLVGGGAGLRDSSMSDFINRNFNATDRVNFTIVNPFNHTIEIFKGTEVRLFDSTLWEEWDYLDTFTGSGNISLAPGLYQFRVTDPTDTYFWDSYDNVEERVWVYPGGTEVLDFSYETTQDAPDRGIFIWDRPEGEGVF